MATRSFDPESWRTRASSRLTRELAWGVPVWKAYQRYGEDTDAIKCIDRLVKWLKRRGTVVFFAPDGIGGTWYQDKKKIRVSSRSRYREQYHTLLHECGHMLVESSATATKDAKYEWGYGKISDLNDPIHRKINVSFRHRIDVVAEEIDAWHAGKKLAKRLKLRLDSDAYEKARSTALKTYVKWSLDKQVDTPDTDPDDIEESDDK